MTLSRTPDPRDGSGIVDSELNLNPDPERESQDNDISNLH